MKFKFIIFPVFFCISTITVAASTQSANDELVQLLGNIHTMQATFEQFMAKHVDQKTIGSMVLERPGKFRWEVAQPNKQLIIINANKLLLYDVDLAQVTKRKMDYKKPGNPAMLLSGSTETLKEMFKITKLKKTNTETWFELKPKKQNSDYQWVKMRFNNGRLNAMYNFDNLDQQSEIHFANVVLNAKILPEKFVFVAPPKVDVLDEG